jgi:hypothetical protein
MTNTPNATAMIPSHAGAELTSGGPPDGAAGSGGGELGTGDGAAGSASVMTDRKVLRRRPCRSFCHFGNGAPGIASLALASRARAARIPAELAVFAGWHGLC